MKWLKVGAVIFVSVIITALAIDAADTLDGAGGTLLGQLIAPVAAGCPAGMVSVPAAQTFTCVDRYEASAADKCPHANPNNAIASSENITTANCQAVSQPDAMPWRFVTREQAATACLRAGKRLLTAAEWFMAAAGTPDAGSCNVNSSGPRAAGNEQTCVSATGVYDAIGNVWEWTSDDVIAGMYNGRPLPASGYVTQVDNGGFPVVTGGSPSSLFFEDYFWSATEGAYGVLRGGFFGSQSDAGVYSTHAQTLPTAAGTAIGFRCVL